MSETKIETLADALSYLVDSIMETYNLDAKKHPEMRTIMLQISAATASLMSKHFARLLPEGPTTTPPTVTRDDEAAVIIPWKKGGSNGIH